MILNDIYGRLKTLDYPVVYNNFKNTVSTPYIVYYEESGTNYGSDGRNFIRKRNIRVNLYCKDKSPIIEKQVEKLLQDFELEVSESYIPEEDVIMISYSFETIEKI